VAKNRNHLELPTFVDSDDPTYVYIRDIFNKSFSRLGLGGKTEENKACLLALQRAHLDQRRTFEATPFSEPGCCDWIFDIAQMRGWLHDTHGTLLIEGLPGSGKTVLAKHLVHQLPKVLEPKSPAVLYHFFRFRDLDFETESDGILASLLYQLCCIDPS
jgi:Cdc6-like AAA superfamily ATPase